MIRDIEINEEEKCVELTKAMFDWYMKHLVQDKYKDFKTWQNKFKDNRLVLVKSKVTKKWSYWGSFEVPSTDDFIWHKASLIVLYNNINNHYI